MDIKTIYTKLEGTKEAANYTLAKGVCPTTGKETQPFYLRIDTGADRTLCLQEFISKIEPLVTIDTLLVRSVGGLNRLNSKDCLIALETVDENWIILKPAKGIIVSNHHTGLLGCDILNQTSMLMINGVIALECLGVLNGKAELGRIRKS